MVFTIGNSRGTSPLRIPPSTPYRQEALSPIEPSLHPTIHQGRVAVITGAASGIGRATAVELARVGLRVALADINEEMLLEAGTEVVQVAGDKQKVLTVPTDVSKLEDVQRLRDVVLDQWGEVAVLLNNAGIALVGTAWEGLENWKKVFDVNVIGVLNVQHTFVPVMLNQENPSVIINTSSKQGITNPPGNAAYNASKASIKILTEQLAHELLSVPSAGLTAHLFIPGWTWTGLTGAPMGSNTHSSANGSSMSESVSISASDSPTANTTITFNAGSRSGSSVSLPATEGSAEGSQFATKPEKPAGAWSATETVLYMLDKVRAGDFYIVCPDNETRPAVDALRVLWGAGDIVERRPALSRWHPDYRAVFDEYMREGLGAL